MGKFIVNMRLTHIGAKWGLTGDWKKGEVNPKGYQPDQLTQLQNQGYVGIYEAGETVGNVKIEIIDPTVS